MDDLASPCLLGVGRVIAESRVPDTGYHGILTRIHDFVNAARLEALRVLHRFSVGSEMPVRARDFGSRALEAIANRHATGSRIGHHVGRQAAIRQRRSRRSFIHLYLRAHRSGDTANDRHVEQFDQ